MAKTLPGMERSGLRIQQHFIVNLTESCRVAGPAEALNIGEAAPDQPRPDMLIEKRVIQPESEFIWIQRFMVESRVTSDLPHA